MPVPTSAAIAIVALLFVIAAVPILLAVRRPNAAATVAGGYAAVLAGGLAWYSGFFAKVDVNLAALAEADRQEITVGQCAQIFKLLDQTGAIVDRRKPPTLVVDGAVWSQLPASAQDAVIGCVERAWPEGSGSAELQQR